MKDKDQHTTPLFDALVQFAAKKPLSFHVPGHKNGAIFPEKAKGAFAPLLPLDLTELTGLDDLHAPEGVIREAEELAAEFFGAKRTFFLVGGSTAGNLAMILAACGRDERIIVQRNCHKSIMNGLELAGARPVFIAPEWDERAGRYGSPGVETLKDALAQYPDAKAAVLTYPDYFGRSYDLAQMIRLCHERNIPVLVDEAHGVHFSLGSPFPQSALSLGADAVVHSAHKMAPAMTMASYLHINGNRVSEERVAHYLQVIQSSSPSYPLMASLDLARMHLATRSLDDIQQMIEDAAKVREMLAGLPFSRVLPLRGGDDPLKVTLHLEGISGLQALKIFENAGIWPELATDNQVLFTLGTDSFKGFEEFKKALQSANEQLKNAPKHATIEAVQLFPEKVQELALSYDAMNHISYREIPFYEGIGQIAAEAVIPYPPGIPLILKGERITDGHVRILKELLKRHIRLQQRHSAGYVKVFV